MTIDDMELLREFALNQSERAFEILPSGKTTIILKKIGNEWKRAGDID